MDNPFSFLSKLSPGGRKSSGSPMSSLGQSVEPSAYGGYNTVTERSPKLQGRQRFVTYSDMLANTSIVATGTRYFLNILANAKWTVDPARDADGEVLPGAQELADAVEAMMKDMTTPWYRIIRRAAMYRFYGFSIQEWTAKRRPDGLIGMLDVEPRPQVTIERWDIDPSGTVLGCWQRLSTGGEVYLPRGKVVHMVDDALNDHPEGLGLFRHLVRPAERIRNYEELEETAFETDLRGIPIARAPLSAIRALETAGTLTAAQVSKMLRPLVQFVSGHIRNKKSGMLLDSETYTTEDDAIRPSNVKKWEMELLQGTSTSQEAVAAAILRTTAEMARILGVEHLLLGADGTGSLALGKVKTNDFYLVVTSTLGEITEQYNLDWLSPIGDMNGWPEELMPTLKTESIQFKDVVEMAETLAQMAQAGAVLGPNDPAINEMRDLMGLSRAPEMDEDDLALTRPPPGDPNADDIEPTEPGAA